MMLTYVTTNGKRENECKESKEVYMEGFGGRKCKWMTMQLFSQTLKRLYLKMKYTILTAFPWYYLWSVAFTFLKKFNINFECELSVTPNLNCHHEKG